MSCTPLSKRWNSQLTFASRSCCTNAAVSATRSMSSSAVCHTKVRGISLLTCCARSSSWKSLSVGLSLPKIGSSTFLVGSACLLLLGREVQAAQPEEDHRPEAGDAPEAFAALRTDWTAELGPSRNESAEPSSTSSGFPPAPSWAFSPRPSSRTRWSASSMSRGGRGPPPPVPCLRMDRRPGAPLPSGMRVPS